MDRADEIVLMQIRLVKLATKTWGIAMPDVAKLFTKNDVYVFIREMYEEFHVQGDSANLEEIKEFLKGKKIFV